MQNRIICEVIRSQSITFNLINLPKIRSKILIKITSCTSRYLLRDQLAFLFFCIKGHKPILLGDVSSWPKFRVCRLTHFVQILLGFGYVRFRRLSHPGLVESPCAKGVCVELPPPVRKFATKIIDSVFVTFYCVLIHSPSPNTNWLPLWFMPNIMRTVHKLALAKITDFGIPVDILELPFAKGLNETSFIAFAFVWTISQNSRITTSFAHSSTYRVTIHFFQAFELKFMAVPN